MYTSWHDSSHSEYVLETSVWEPTSCCFPMQEERRVINLVVSIRTLNHAGGYQILYMTCYDHKKYFFKLSWCMRCMKWSNRPPPFFLSLRLFLAPRNSLRLWSSKYLSSRVSRQFRYMTILYPGDISLISSLYNHLMYIKVIWTWFLFVWVSGWQPSLWMIITISVILMPTNTCLITCTYTFASRSVVPLAWPYFFLIRVFPHFTKLTIANKLSVSSLKQF